MPFPFSFALNVPGIANPFAPPPGDEGQHNAPADAGPLFNESYYFDAVAPDGSIGMYARVGRLPNQDCCSFVGGIFRQGKEPILFIDMNAPLPPSNPKMQKFQTDKFSVESTCIEPLKKFNFKLYGQSERLLPRIQEDRTSQTHVGQHNVLA